MAPADVVLADGVGSGGNRGRQEGGGGDSGGDGGNRSVRGRSSGAARAQAVKVGGRWLRQGRWARRSIGKRAGLASGQHGGLAVQHGQPASKAANMARCAGEELLPAEAKNACFRPRYEGRNEGVLD